MFCEIWTPWKPENIILEGKYSIEAVHYKEATTHIIMCSVHDKNKKIKVSFGNANFSYRKTNGVFMEDKLTYLKEKYGEKFYTEWSFFTVEHSSYEKWATEETYGMFDSYFFINFSFQNLRCDFLWSNFLCFFFFFDLIANHIFFFF